MLGSAGSMSDLRIEFDQATVARVVRKMGLVAALSTIRPAIERSVARLRRELAHYPPPAHRRQPPKNERQRRKVWALRRQGKIPYQRTGTLGRKWTSTVHPIAGGIEGVVGNDTPYGPFVQGGSTQAAYHRGVW